MNDFQELVLEEIRSIEKELQDIRSILEPKKFVPEDSCGKIYSTEKCSNPWHVLITKAKLLFSTIRNSRKLFLWQTNYH